MKRLGGFLGVVLIILFLCTSANAITVPLTLVDAGIYPGTGTRIYQANLTGIAGLTQIGSIKITDDGTTTGGAPGIFSGFDLDAIFLDDDGDLIGTTADQHFASSYLFSAGSTRSTSNSAYLPNVTHPGPTFGSVDATTIDHGTATLTAIDGVSVADVNTADGFLTLGDGGWLVANYSPEIPISGSLFLITGEVGGQPGEFIGASVEVSDQVIPEPTTIVISGLALLGMGVFVRRKIHQ